MPRSPNRAEEEAMPRTTRSPSSTARRSSYLSLIRKRKVGDGFHEDVTVFNHGNERKDVEIRLEAGADFADLFEVKDALDKKGESISAKYRTDR
jgi:hypothetical protein